MASVVQICNMALTRIGQNQFIDSIDEQSKAAELCALHYELCRDEVLQSFPWPFAEARVALADIGTPPLHWAYRYRYPVDCLQIRSISIDGVVMPRASERVPYQVVNATGGRAIVTNQDKAQIRYTARVEDTTYFSPMFTNALAWRLAAELAMGLQAKPENYQAAMQNYQITLSQAEALAFEESEEGPIPDSEFIQARN